jgi:hypothetical protein
LRTHWLILSALTVSAQAQPLEFKPLFNFQGWGVHSEDGRNNFYVRRGRVGVEATPYQNLLFVVSGTFDNTGLDAAGATRGRATQITNQGPELRLWDTFLSWKLTEGNAAFLTAGYMRPQLSRESITPAFRVNSFEKSIVQNYVRKSAVGREHGRTTGINLGGLLEQGLHYNFGVFNKLTTPNAGEEESQGSPNSLVYVGRVAFNLGDPELTRYALILDRNFFGRRRGLTIAANGSYQGPTPDYQANATAGTDVLFNWDNWNVDGEFFWLYQRPAPGSGAERSRTGHLRVGHNFLVKNGTVIEPSLMLAQYQGEVRDRVIDVGMNWYLDGYRYKLYTHFVKQEPRFGDYFGAGVNLLF